MKDAYEQYRNDRYKAHITRRNSLNDLAFKTSERYDQWVLTLSGGALAISLTFIEKIAPGPARWTLILLGLSWLAYIFAVLAGFAAIFFSREAIYKQLDIDDAVYEQFGKTSTEEKPEGESLSESVNPHIRTLKILNRTSISCLTFGTFLMCWFALSNIASAKAHKEQELPSQIDVNMNLLQVPTNYNITTTATKYHEQAK
jgi:hypothetical protein